MTRRSLRPDELELWQMVAQSAHRLVPEKTRPAPPKPMPKPAIVPLAPLLPEFRLGERASKAAARHDVLPGLSERLANTPVRMDNKAFGRLKRGKLVPEGRIDLHGMTLDQAHSALNLYILRAQAAEKRLVLVITGKGKAKQDHGPIPVRQGVLRHQVPHWLTLPPLAQAVLQIAEAHVSHGGSGAFYVYLRRNR